MPRGSFSKNSFFLFWNKKNPSMAACFFSQKDLKCINFVIWRQTKSFGHDWLIELLYRHQIFLKCSALLLFLGKITISKISGESVIKVQPYLKSITLVILFFENLCTFFMLLHIFSIQQNQIAFAEESQKSTIHKCRVVFYVKHVR